MALQITLLKTPGKVSVSRTTLTFKEQGGTLGRGDSNTWVLPDPDRFLSSCHCEILVEGNRYFLLDLSTNGTFLNGSPEPLGKGSRAPLGEGDFFELGDYRFSVKVIAENAFAESSPFGATQHSTGSASLDDIFGSPLSGNADFADPFSRSSSLGSELSLSPDIENMDPLFALDRAQRSPNAKATNTFGIFDQKSDSLEDLLFAGGSAVDHSPSMDQAMTWPESKQETLIPDDWEDDLLGNSAPKTPVASTPIPPNPRPSRPALREKPKLPLAERIGPLDAGVLDAQAPAAGRPAPPAPKPVNVQPVAPAVAPTPHAPAAQQPIAPVKPTAVNRQAPDNRLIAAMGLDARSLSEEQINQISETAGELMREIVDGMMQILRSRTSIKNEFRMNVTTIQPVENNPLKFSVGVDEALENLFVKQSNAYQKPIDAFREGFQEIGEHQLAMIAGIRLGFGRMMERFNPETLEKNFNKQGKGGVIPGMQKTKYWNFYGEYYKGLQDNMESSFQHLFGSDFVQAYEDQLRKLWAARKRNK